MKNKIINLLLLLLIGTTSSLWAQYSGGEGTATSPYQISSLEDFKSLSAKKSDWDKHYILTQDIDATASQSLQTADGLQIVGLVPIGTKSLPFTGSIDGQGYTIDGLFINRTEASELGLFGQLSSASITNISLTNARVNGHDNVGLLIGASTESIVENCHVSGNVTASGSNSGLLAGVMGGTVRNSSATGDIEGNNYVGGFCGISEAATSVCHAIADVVGLGDNVGGFAGLLSKPAEVCYASGDVQGAENVGGFAGAIYHWGETSVNLFSYGQVSGSVAYIGGFVGAYKGGTVAYAYTQSTVSAIDGYSIAYDEIGAFSGFNNIYSTYLVSCFYNKEIAGVTNQYTGAKGLSNAKFLDEANFTSWDFENDWMMAVLPEISALSHPYPQGSLKDGYISYESTIADAGVITADSGWYYTGEELTFVASDAASPYVFDGWYLNDEEVTTSKSITFTVDGDATYTAKYKAEYGGGNGTAEDPFQIKTLDHLSILQQTVEDYDKHFIVMNDIDASATQQWVDAEVSTTKGFLSIGNTELEFSGVFDGQGYTISGLYIHNVLQDHAGLFGVATEASISNVNMVDVNVTANDCASGLVGLALKTPITNCTISGIVSGNNNVGLLSGYVTQSTVLNTHSSGEVHGASVNTGGLIGFSGEGTLERSSSSALVSGYARAGGLIGLGRSDIKYCFATGDVIGSEHVGGFAGAVYSSISYCFAHGNVSQIESSQLPLGATFGYVGGFAGSITYALISYSYSIGEVYGETTYGAFYGGFDGDYAVYPEYCVFDAETCGLNEDDSEGLTALNTVDFADLQNLPGDWQEEWGVSLLSEYDAVTRPYFHVLLDYDYQFNYTIENAKAGSVTSSAVEGWVKETDNITLTATTYSGFTFDGWYVDDVKVSSDLVYTFNPSGFDTYIAKHNTIEVGFSGGQGLPSDPYLLSNLDDLVLLSSRINDFRYDHFVITNDIDASASSQLYEGLGFDPIGITEYENVFEGSLDGQGYSISNLTINRPEQDYVGLFLSINGDVTNLVIEDANINGHYAVGVLTGHVADEATINLITIKRGEVNGFANVGGLLGYSYVTDFDKLKFAYVTNCTVQSTAVSGNSNIGGLVGLASNVINKSYAEANVSGVTHVGGLVGYFRADNSDNSLYIENSYSQSEVNGSSSVGGLVGTLYQGTINKGYANTQVNYLKADTITDGKYYGGLVGRIFGGQINNSYATGTVNALDIVGGLIGDASGLAVISNTYAATSVVASGMFTGGYLATISGDKVQVADAYFDTDVSGTTYAYYSDASSLAKIEAYSSDQMSEPNNFSNFDFDGVWEMNTKDDDLLRPYLKWEYSSTSINVTVTPSEIGTVTGTGWYNVGEEVILNAECINGWKFSAWKIGDRVYSNDANYTFTVEANQPYDLTAVFVQDFSASGEGTVDSPYKIYTLSQLEELSNLPSLWDKHFILMNNIDASSTGGWNLADHDQDIHTAEVPTGFSPLGNDETIFSGSFDGNGKVISGLYIYRPMAYNVALFGNIKGVTIKDLTLDNCDFTGFNSVGALAGNCHYNEFTYEGYYSKIENCHVINSTIEGGSYVGGIISNTYAVDLLNNTVEDVMITAIEYAGGIVGDLLESTTVMGCYASGVIEATGNNIGGIVGRATAGSELTDCHASVDINGAQNIGGFVGNASGSVQITDSYATGNIYAGGTYGIVGGFVGYALDSYISNCYATGDVESNDLFAGGFVGYSEGGSVSIIEKSYATGDVIARRYSGGFGGQLNSHIKYSYSTGNVDGLAEDPDDTMDLQIGGFAGHTESSCYISNCFSLSNVIGNIYVAGFVGVNMGVIENSYCAGEVECEVAGEAGFISYNDDDATVKGCYYDNTLCSASAIYDGEKSGVTALETASFAKEEDMPAFGFGSIWYISVMSEYDSQSRPYLKWNKSSAYLNIELSAKVIISCVGNGWYDEGDAVSLNVIESQPGLAFDHWETEGKVVSSDINYQFSFVGNEDVTYLAIFSEENVLTEGEGTTTSPYIISDFNDLLCLSNVSSIWDKHFELGNDIDASASSQLNNKEGMLPIGSDSVSFTGTFDGKSYVIEDLFINRNTEDGQAMFGFVGDTAGNAAVIKNISLVGVAVGGANGTGSLVGDLVNSEVLNCHSDGYVFGVESFVGGLVGRSREASLIKNSSYKGTVYSPSYDTNTSVGGLVGYNSNSYIEHCYAITDSVSSAGEAVGGLVGYNDNLDADNNPDYGIKQSFAVSGNVTSSSDQLGGLVGVNRYASISECYVSANLTKQSSMALSVGGLVGEYYGGNVEKSYFNYSKQDASDNGVGTRLNTAGIQDPSMYSGWKFGEEGGWQIAISANGEASPCFFELPTYTVTYKTSANGSILPMHANTKMEEVTDVVLQGFDSRDVTALPDVGYEFYRWEVESGGLWDTDNVTTFIPSIRARDLTLVAVFNTITALNDIDAEALIVYPNPLTDVMYIDGIKDNATVNIFDLAGKMVLSVSTINKQAIDLSTLNKGMYTVRVETSNGIKTIKVIKQ